MRKINGTEPKEKSVPVTSRNTFDTNQIERLSGNSNGLSAFDSTKKMKICNAGYVIRRCTNQAAR